VSVYMAKSDLGSSSHRVHPQKAELHRTSLKKFHIFHDMEFVKLLDTIVFITDKVILDKARMESWLLKNEFKGATEAFSGDPRRSWLRTKGDLKILLQILKCPLTWVLQEESSTFYTNMYQTVKDALSHQLDNPSLISPSNLSHPTLKVLYLKHLLHTIIKVLQANLFPSMTQWNNSPLILQRMHVVMRKVDMKFVCVQEELSKKIKAEKIKIKKRLKEKTPHGFKSNIFRANTSGISKKKIKGKKTKRVQINCDEEGLDVDDLSNEEDSFYEDDIEIIGRSLGIYIGGDGKRYSTNDVTFKDFLKDLEHSSKAPLNA
nr:hypothetical protein [Tanacetum cinerariifolium]